MMNKFVLFLLAFTLYATTAWGAIILDEKFEGAGYEEGGWLESVGAGATVDEDAASSDVSSPTNWGSQCLKIIDPGGVVTRTRLPHSEDLTTSYYRVEVYITAESLADGQYTYIAQGSDIAGTKRWQITLKQNTGGQLVFRSLINGGTNVDLCNAATNTLYRLEVKWIAAEGAFEFKVNGVSCRTGTTPATSTVGNWYCGSNGTDTNAATVYYDLFAIDDADWIGAEAVATTSQIIMVN